MIRPKDIILKSGDMEKIVGMTHDEFTYIRRRGLISPKIEGAGQGSDNIYGVQELCTLSLISELRSIGIDTDTIKAILTDGQNKLGLLWDEIIDYFDRSSSSLLPVWIIIEKRESYIVNYIWPPPPRGGDLTLRHGSSPNVRIIITLGHILFRRLRAARSISEDRNRESWILGFLDEAKNDPKKIDELRNLLIRRQK